MMKRNKMLFFLVVVVSCVSAFSQSVVIDRLGEIPHDESGYSSRHSVTGMGYSPATINIDEVSGTLGIEEFVTGIYYSFLLEKDNLSLISSYASDPTYASVVINMGEYMIGFSEHFILLKKEKREIVRVGSKFSKGGVSFIIKKNKEYIIFYDRPDGSFGAVDTGGKMYSYREVLALLAAYDPVKFEQSIERARELDLEESLRMGNSLVWGKTYYAPVEKLERFWNAALFPSSSALIQYDIQGNNYQASLNSGAGTIWIVDSDANYLAKIDVTKNSRILDTYERGRIFTTSTYVGFGGNIYFYIAGDEFTEVFRIRRTWGDPDFYAMAINGYTEDEYGAYVKETLKSLTKEELRLLRNHLFALYGYVFKSEDLARYFDKQVWYLPDAGATMESIELPSERKALLDMLLAEEKTR